MFSVNPAPRFQTGPTLHGFYFIKRKNRIWSKVEVEKDLKIDTFFVDTLSNLYHKISQLSTIVVDDPKQSVPVYIIIDLVICYNHIVKKEVQY